MRLLANGTLVRQGPSRRHGSSFPEGKLTRDHRPARRIYFCRNAMPKPLPQVDAALLARAQHGDREAHAHLYQLFASPVFTLARRMLASRALAEDVLQETFVEVLRKVSSYRGEAEFGFWIKRIAINKCL